MPPRRSLNVLLCLFVPKRLLHHLQGAVYCDRGRMARLHCDDANGPHSQLANMGTDGTGGPQPTLNLGNLNPNILHVEYAVRGPLVIRACELEKELLQGAQKPFKSVIKANIGDAQAMGQKPVTFLRQMLALTSYPHLLDSAHFPDDVKAGAKRLLHGCGGCSLGSYSNSTGAEVVRRDVAAFIEKRDGGVLSDPENIVLANGASTAIRDFLAMFNRTAEDEYSGDKLPAGVMVPIPQYPLYSATISEYGMHQIGYFLDEAHGWSLDVAELQRAVHAARKSSNPRVIVVINPGNPTGQVLTRDNIENIVRFAYEQRLFLFADEVYQDNVYDPESKFHSFKKVMFEMGHPYSSMELVSFHSVSKGYLGECGLRGGYAEIVNCDRDVMAQFKKAISARLCSTLVGQVAVDCLVKPPEPGDESYALHEKERRHILETLAHKARMVYAAYNSIAGISCNAVQGAMYAFPNVRLPEKAIRKAQDLGQEPDFYYAMQLLEETGICVVPGSGFGQKPATWHFRTTILPSAELFQQMLQRFQTFHQRFLAEHAK